MASIGYIEERIEPLRRQLAGHPLYARMKSADDIRTFMEHHVYAVWDFMSLLTALRRELICVKIPWRPTRFPDSRRFINEIALGEESDTFQGRSISHFELYLEAMDDGGADTRRIRNLLANLQANLESGAPGETVSAAMERASVPAAARQFVDATFRSIESENASAIAAAFTFGREDLIPAMFRELARDLDNSGSGNFGKLIWYLERHIELDGDDHGPLALKMVSDLCGSDEKLWTEAAEAAQNAISARIALWDGILASLDAR